MNALESIEAGTEFSLTQVHTTHTYLATDDGNVFVFMA